MAYGPGWSPGCCCGVATPFGIVDSAWLAAQRAVLGAERFAAELDRNDVALRLGGLAGESVARVGRRGYLDRHGDDRARAALREPGRKP